MGASEATIAPLCSSLLIAFTCSLIGAASAPAEPSTLVAYASDSGTGQLGSGFDSGVSKPKKMVLKVKVEPNVRIELEYDVFCRGHGQRKALTRQRTTRSRRIRLPLLVDKPSGCLVFAFGAYEGSSRREAKFRIELRAKSRGYQPPPPEPIPAEDVRARLKVKPRLVGASRKITVRAIGRDARKFITGIDLRLDRPTPDAGWEPAYALFTDWDHDGEAADPVALPPSEPILIPLVGIEPTSRRTASLKGVEPGPYRLRMHMSPDEDRGFPDNVRLYRELTVQPVG